MRQKAKGAAALEVWAGVEWGNERVARLTCSGRVAPAGEQCVEADPSYLMLLEAEPSLRL